MRILLMIDWFLYYTVELANALVQDHQVMLVTRDHNFEISSPDKPVDLDTFLDEVLDKRIVREKLRYRRRSPKNVSEVPRVLRSIRAFSPDVVHIQENKDWRITWIANKLGFRKTVLTVHDVAAHPGHRRQLQGYISWIPRFRAARVIVHGEFLKGFLSSRFKIQRSRIHVVPHGAFSIYNKWDDGNIREEENTVLFFGRIMKYKGLDVLIKSCPLIASEIPDIKIIIAGRGNDFSMYESMMEDRSRFEVHHRFIANVEGLACRAPLHRGQPERDHPYCLLVRETRCGDRRRKHPGGRGGGEDGIGDSPWKPGGIGKSYRQLTERPKAQARDGPAGQEQSGDRSFLEDRGP